MQLTKTRLFALLVAMVFAVGAVAAAPQADALSGPYTVKVDFKYQDGSSKGSVEGSGYDVHTYSTEATNGGSLAKSVDSLVTYFENNNMVVTDWGGYSPNTTYTQHKTYTIKLGPKNGVSAMSTVTVNYVDVQGNDLGGATGSGYPSNKFTEGNPSLASMVQSGVAELAEDNYSVSDWGGWNENANYPSSDKTYTIKFAKAAVPTSTVTVKLTADNGKGWTQSATADSGTAFSAKLSSGETFAATVDEQIAAWKADGYTLKNDGGWPGASGTFTDTNKTYTVTFTAPAQAPAQMGSVKVNFVDDKGASLGSIFLDSSMVEHPAVNRVVAGSSPARGAFWPHGQAVKTSPFHGGNSGSIPDGVTFL